MTIESTFGILIKQIHSGLEKDGNNRLRKNGITISQMDLLMCLNKFPQKTTSFKTMERMLGVAQSTTAGIISRLEQKGFVESFGDSSDKRIKMVKMTPKGERRCADAEYDIMETEKKLLSDLTDEEQRTLKQLLERIKNSIQ